MAHTQAFKQLIRLLQQARCANLQAEGRPRPITQEEWQKSRRRFLKTATAAGIGSVMTTGLPGALGYVYASRDDSSTRVAIVGGGLAGLNAAYQLKQAGIHAKVYEASARLGGRVLSKTGSAGDELIVEYGGEFINTDHTDMLDLVQDFGLTLFDRKADAATVTVPASAYYFNGKAWPETKLIELLKPLVIQISQDAELLDEDWDKYAPQFDRLSVKDYLDQHAALIPQPFIRTLFEGAIRVEYGGEASGTTCLQLLFLLPSIDGSHVELLGYSDEAFTVQGGNSRIIEGLSHSLEGKIHTGRELIQLDAKGKSGFKLKFKDGALIEADYVILAIPFSVLREVKIDAPLPGKLKQFIQQANLGRNEKLMAGFSERVWRQAPGFSLEAWTDLGYSETWDASQRQSDRHDGVLTYYFGGDEVNTLNNWPGDIAAAGVEFTKRLAKFIPDLNNKATGNYVRTGWTRNPYIRGSYVNFQPGQLTQFGEYFWIESDDPAERQAVHAGGLIFAGEHLSDEFYGFMNGAAQTGRLAAQLVQAMLLKEKNK
jgi:monoamine oxidase